MNDALETTKAPCKHCGRSTRHSILHAIEKNGDADYMFSERHEIIQCLGCENTAFRYVFDDIQNAYPTDFDNWEVPSEVSIYPKFIESHRELDGMHAVPQLVREIYQESLLAIKEEALTLAGLGLRGIIEAICNERGISGRNLEARIGKLASQGLISTKDAERLHAIRFLGNDAAHDIKKPKTEQIGVALKIIEHLMASVYILDLEAAGRLDTLVTQLDQLKDLLSKKLKDYAAGDQLPLAKFLGKDMRRLGTEAPRLESLLIAEIQAGTYTKLTLGPTMPFAGSSAALQHYIVM